MTKNFTTQAIRTLLIAISLLSMNTLLNAQVTITETQEKKVNFQIRGGLTLSNLTASWTDSRDNATMIAGFNLGGIADFSLGKDIYLQTGLSFISKGAKIENLSVDGQNMDATMRAQYLQIPVYLAYKIKFAQSANKLNLAVGPYFAYGIAGKTSLSQNGSSSSYNFNTFESDGIWNRPDIGLGYELQFEMEKLIFLMGSELGIARVWKKSALSDPDVHVRNTSVHLSIGYKF